MPITQYDDTNLPLIPADAVAVAGYINGHYANYTEVLNKWPHAHHLSIDVNGSANADCLDIEKGDATNATAPGWVRRQKARGIHRPCLYTSVSNANALLDTLAHAGIGRKDIRLWLAHYTLKPHICSPACWPGLKTVADGTQWTSRARGMSLDQSLMNDAFYGLPQPVPGPLPVPVPKPKLFPKAPVPMPAWWWAWADWRRQTDLWKRPMSPRPPTPARIPLWAWGALIAYNKKYPIGK